MTSKVNDDGLEEGQAVALAQSMTQHSQDGGTQQDRHSVLFQLAEQTLVEAHKLAEGIEEKARQEAETEAARIQSDAEEKARQQAAMIIDTAQSEAHAKSKAIVAEAKQEAQQVMKQTQREAEEILEDAKQTAENLQSQAKLQAELLVRNVTVRFTDEIGSAVKNISSYLLSSLDDSPVDSDTKAAGRSRGARAGGPDSASGKSRASSKS
ncbi:MAG: hypothetical protein ACE5JL_05065 [Dehalococcoidia bacterium]